MGFVSVMKKIIKKALHVILLLILGVIGWIVWTIDKIVSKLGLAMLPEGTRQLLGGLYGSN